MHYNIQDARNKKYEAYYLVNKKPLTIYDKTSNVDIFDIELFINIEVRKYIEARWISLVGGNEFDGESAEEFADRTIDNIIHDLVLNNQVQMNMGDFFVECLIDKDTTYNMFCVKEILCL
tara:strand:- start:4098 stop:4457 length:360 start_codon:yes stop_codon:yes gene_type:complete